MQELTKEGVKVRVVSMPCMELFAKQTPEYQASVVPRHVSIKRHSLLVSKGSYDSKTSF
jgi:transketolase